HSDASININTSTYPDQATPSADGDAGTATAIRAVWTPAAAPLIIPATFPPSCTVEILATEGGRTLVAAIELVSPGNKDRESKRRLFAAKCATYLSRGIGLIVVDIVTSRKGNLHNDLLVLMGLEASMQMPPDQSL